MEIKINNRIIGKNHKPFVIAEIGINHEEDIKKALKMVNDVNSIGCNFKYIL